MTQTETKICLKFVKYQKNIKQIEGSGYLDNLVVTNKKETILLFSISKTSLYIIDVKADCLHL